MDMDIYADKDFAKVVAEYVRLSARHGSGDEIWRLCELSAGVIGKYQRGGARALAEACRPRVSVDVIEVRARAWRCWEAVRECEIVDEDGSPLRGEVSWVQVRAMLSYSHFSAAGRSLDFLDVNSVARALVLAAKDSLSVAGLMRCLEDAVRDASASDDLRWRRAVVGALRSLDRLRAIASRQGRDVPPDVGRAIDVILAELGRASDWE